MNAVDVAVVVTFLAVSKSYLLSELETTGELPCRN